MELERREASLIQSAVPASRGPLRHFEHSNETAFTRFKGDLATEIHTPQNTLKRIHEVMHARHTDTKSYPGIRPEVWEIIEDCRLHMHHWPWPNAATPDGIKTDTIATIRDELARLSASKLVGYGNFATKLRAHAVYRGLAVPRDTKLYPDFDKDEALFAQQVLDLINKGKHELAARLVETVYFDKPKKDGDADKDEVEYARDGKLVDVDEDGEPIKGKIKVTGKKDTKPDKAMEEAKLYGGPCVDPEGRMEIIELEKVEPTQSADAGFRLATSGSRLYRPALRRPILSPRLFLKKSPYDPIGVICFDSSGSMSVDPALLNDCCRRAPTAVVGYYEGRDGTSTGWLWVYARDGMRARATPLTGYGGNAVDGPAMDWMLTFDGPRIMVTDRGFCGAHDNVMQLARLSRLEREGEIKVYESFALFQKAFPQLTA